MTRNERDFKELMSILRYKNMFVKAIGDYNIDRMHVIAYFNIIDEV